MCKLRVLATFLSFTGILLAFGFQISKADCHTSIWGVQLANHVMSTLTIGDIDTCYRICAAKLGCKSVNFYREKSLCELNSRTIENTPEMTVVNEDSAYFKIPDDGGQVIRIFPQASLQNKAVLENWFGSLKAFTMCSWNQPTSKSEQAIFSYATLDNSNEIFVTLMRHSSTTFLSVYLTEWTSPTGEAVYLVDGDWHHVCLTWENNDGKWKIYIDGVMKAEGRKNPGRVISGTGAVVLGQDQDTVIKGGFQLHQSHQGNLTNVNLWDRVLTPEEVTGLSRSCSAGEGNVIMWSDFTARIEGNIKLLRSHHGCGK